MSHLLELPLLGGFLGIVMDASDPKRDLVFIVSGLTLVVLAIESAGFHTGNVGVAITSGFTLLLGYYFRGKEEQLKVLNGQKKEE